MRGVLLDLSRRKLVVSAEAEQRLVALGLLANSVLPDPAVWPLSVFAALASGCHALLRPPLDAHLRPGYG